jgi:dGTPase
VTGLFEHLFLRSEELPSEWQAHLTNAVDEADRARVVADYIAGMTDRYALQQHATIKSGTAPRSDV